MKQKITIHFIFVYATIKPQNATKVNKKISTRGVE